jgi:L-aminopeptidase/D-esterase-like protein
MQSSFPPQDHCGPDSDPPAGAITDIPGILVGHAADESGKTGCTVIYFEEDAVGGIDIRGTAAGTRQVEALRSFHLVEKIQAILLTGGSAFGMDASGGVMRYLEEQERGFDVQVTRIPIVPTAVLFDLAFARPGCRPDGPMGYQACVNMKRTTPEGSVGAGTGATVGKLYGLERAIKGGLGTVCLKVGKILVAALVVVNAFGDVVNDETGQIIAGTRDLETGKKFIDTFHMIQRGNIPQGKALFNTTLGVVATNVALNRPQTNKLARMAHNGLVKTIRPVNSSFDGDVVFSVSLGGEKADLNMLGAMADTAVRESVKRAVRLADGFGILPTARDFLNK